MESRKARRVQVDPDLFRLVVSRNGVSLPARLIDLSQFGLGAYVYSAAMAEGQEVSVNLRSDEFEVDGLATCTNAIKVGDSIRAGFNVTMTVGDDLAEVMKKVAEQTKSEPKPGST